MSKLLVKPQGKHGRITHITPESAGWDYVGFDMHRLRAGETVSDNTGDREVCLVYVTGKGTARAGDEDFGSLGKRMSPFEGVPAAIYVPAHTDWTVTAETEMELAVCSAPDSEGSLPPRLIRSEDLSKETRGHGTNTRYVTQHPSGGPAGSVSSGRGSNHPGRTHIILPAAQARSGQPAA